MQNEKYFFGATGIGGFRSFFEEIYDPRDGWRAYIIKGGPGSGKSSLMKKVAAAVADSDCVLGLCSSDPDSLDAVVFPFRKVCLIDGTAPHVIEPKYPGMCETIINPGDFWDKNMLYSSRDELLCSYDKNARLHKTAARYLGAAGRLKADNFYLERCCADIGAARSAGARLVKKYLTRGAGQGREHRRFLSAVTPKGYLRLDDSLSDELILIEDKGAAVGSAMLEAIRDEAVASGYDCLVCPDPILPDLLLEAVIIPGISKSFLVSEKSEDFAVRSVHASRFIDKAALYNVRQKLKFNKKAAGELVAAAADTLKEAKDEHDIMESFYISAMDFSRLDEITEKIIKEITA